MGVFHQWEWFWAQAQWSSICFGVRSSWRSGLLNSSILVECDSYVRRIASHNRSWEWVYEHVQSDANIRGTWILTLLWYPSPLQLMAIRIEFSFRMLVRHGIPLILLLCTWSGLFVILFDLLSVQCKSVLVRFDQLFVRFSLMIGGNNLDIVLIGRLCAHLEFRFVCSKLRLVWSTQLLDLLSVCCHVWKETVDQREDHHES